MQMNKLTIAFATTMALASFGCKKKADTAGSGEAMAKMTEFKDKMCACKDAECAKKVNDDMTKWSQEQNAKTKGSVALSEADQKKATEIGTAMGDCQQKASAPAAGSDMAGSAAAGSGDMAGSAAGSAAGSGDMAGSAAAGSAAAGSAAAGSAAAGSAAAGSAAAGSGSAETK
jgi:hypothetical protein